MRKSTPTIEWHIAESDADWVQRPGSSPLAISAGASPHWRLQRILWPVAAPLLLLVSTDSRRRSEQATASQQPVVGVTTITQAQLQARAPDSQPAAIRLPSDQAAINWPRQQLGAQTSAS